MIMFSNLALNSWRLNGLMIKKVKDFLILQHFLYPICSAQVFILWGFYWEYKGDFQLKIQCGDIHILMLPLGLDQFIF